MQNYRKNLYPEINQNKVLIRVGKMPSNEYQENKTINLV